MLQTRQDMEIELVSRLMIANNSSLFPATRITEVINQSCKWAGSLRFWPSLQHAFKTTAAANTSSLKYDYYDYPANALTDSAARLMIDGNKYYPKRYQDVIDYAESANYPTIAPDPTKRIFGSFGRQFFVYPSYTGSPPANNLVIWCNIQHPDLSLPTDTTIFSLWDDSGNEAIVKKAFSVLMKRLEAQTAAVEEQGAVQLLQVLWQRVMDEQQKAQPFAHPMFQVPDYFSIGSGMSTIGNFGSNVDIIG